jgi:ribosomal protein S18 acetylase RimI-like enzyme
MNNTNFSKLDNPAWHSLNETHQSLALSSDEIKFYLPGVCPFGGMASPEADLPLFMNTHAPTLNSFFVIGNQPEKISGLLFEKELVCLQMVCSEKIKVEPVEEIIALQENHTQQLVHLVNRVQPGYFKEGTVKMGEYYGIFKNNELVAATGERMKMYGFTEISAVVTHPDFTGKGFAKQLVAYTANKNFEQGIVPYLHVAGNNAGVIGLYEKLGFVTRRKISFWKMKRTE